MNSKSLSIIAVLTLLAISCSKDSSSDENTIQLPELPALEEVDDVCTKMDDMNFMSYCYENFDLNNDSRVSMAEANAILSIECDNASSFAGLEYFAQLKDFKSSSVKTADFRYNTELENIDCSYSPIEVADMRYNDKLLSILFTDCKYLNSVSLPNSITRIESEAFFGCKMLGSIDIPDNVVTIGWAAFFGCYKLTLIDASTCRKLEEIERQAFETCPIEQFLLGTSIPPLLSTIHNLNLNHFDLDLNAVLKVPAESVDAYKNSRWAKYFKTIEAL